MAAGSWVGPVEIVRVPVDFAIRDRAALPPGPTLVQRVLDPAAEARAKARIAGRERDVSTRATLAPRPGSAGGPNVAVFKLGVAERKLERLVLRGLREAARVHGGLSRRVARRLAARAAAAAGTTAVRWRVEHPVVLDYEVAFGPVVDALLPDVIHAHDMHLVSVAAHARSRARAAGRDVPWVYDAHEYVRGLSQYGARTPTVIAGWADLEAEFIRDAARVITVSPAIADELQRVYGLSERPSVVLNIPTADPPGPEPVRPLRDVCGLGPDVPLLSYSGGMTRARGVHTAIDAMVELPEAHLGLVCVPHNETWFVRKLRKQVADMGLGDRVHFVNPVGPGQVVEYLRGVDVGLIPILSYASHEMALPNKLFEYLHAGVPVVSSELQSLGEFLRATGVGVTFPPEDAKALAAAVRVVLADHERFAAAAGDPELLATYSWSRQADELRRVYAGLLGRELAARSDLSEEIIDLSELARRPA
jgi:glycosyltransferase involved in cell wall biosynthesis